MSTTERECGCMMNQGPAAGTSSRAGAGRFSVVFGPGKRQGSGAAIEVADLETWRTEMSNCIRLYCQMGMRSASNPAERADLGAWRDQIQVCIDRYNSVREEVIQRHGASSVRSGPFSKEGVPRF